MSNTKTVPIGELPPGTIVNYEGSGFFEILPFDTPPKKYIRPDWVKLIVVGHPDSMYHQEPQHLVAVDRRAWESFPHDGDRPKSYIVTPVATPVTSIPRYVELMLPDGLKEWDE